MTTGTGITESLDDDGLSGMRKNRGLRERLRAPAYWMSGSSDGHEGENNAPYEAADLIDDLVGAIGDARAGFEAVQDIFAATRNGPSAAVARQIARLDAALAKAKP